MLADFWAGYLSGAAGIVIGNPLDIVKTRLQAGGTERSEAQHSVPSAQSRTHFDRASALVRGATAPILGYGALNAILYVAYNRSLLLLGSDPVRPSNYWHVWAGGAIGGLATFVVSAPTEVIKCRVQVAADSSPDSSSWATARDIWRRDGLRGMYCGGGITSMRDSVGYGFYFWTYELCKQSIVGPDDSHRDLALKVLLCGGIAGIATWASIFPLDVIKTKVQTQPWQPLDTTTPTESRRLLGDQSAPNIHRRKGAVEIARMAYQQEGLAVFFRGLGVCSLRAFIVNAVQWAVYESVLQSLIQRR